MASYEIYFDDRLGMNRPRLLVDYDSLSAEQQQEFELKCQEICSYIPERIKAFESRYMSYYEQLKEADDETFFLYNEEMNQISEIICDLNLLYLYIEGNFLNSTALA
ncbi:hypothetical protein IC620_12460 [Hazenella sp. IB182357]|uniref:Uncharacterized protein n=1 Tax=Polycladospora coralii TaxID=2771432 RepID=A0A926RUM6_9BACL|nr:hypothetical protein [Polycladospora coralii]MBD1373168.1 hypothetical protein [Polycladospora coralii]